MKGKVILVKDNQLLKDEFYNLIKKDIETLIWTEWFIDKSCITKCTISLNNSSIVCTGATVKSPEDHYDKKEAIRMAYNRAYKAWRRRSSTFVVNTNCVKGNMALKSYGRHYKYYSTWSQNI